MFTVIFVRNSVFIVYEYYFKVLISSLAAKFRRHPTQENDWKTKGHGACTVAHVFVAASDAILVFGVTKATRDAVGFPLVAAAIDQRLTVDRVPQATILGNMETFRALTKN